MQLTRISGLFCCAALALLLAGAAQGSLEVGVTEDAGKATGGGAAFFASLTDLGLTSNRVSIPWDAANPTLIQSQAEKDWLNRLAPLTARRRLEAREWLLGDFWILYYRSSRAVYLASARHQREAEYR